MSSGGKSVDAAFDRFNIALDAIDGAEMRRKRNGKSVDALEKEIQTLMNDRSELARELDEMRAYASQLESIQEKAGGRIDAAVKNIRSVLD